MRALPKSVQLSEMLIREIASGKLPDGARLPPEKEMAEDLGVATGTLRKALAILTDKGLLKRVQGSGNYIQARTDIESVYAFFRLELVQGGGLPTAEIVSVDCHVRPEQARKFLSDYAHRIRRLRYLDSTPIAVEEIWLDADFIKTLAPGDLSDSLYFFYKQELGLIIASVEDWVGVGQVPAWRPDRFALAIGAPCGFIERYSYDQSARVSEYSQTWFNPAVARYVMRLQ